MRADTSDLTVVMHGPNPIVLRPVAIRVERRQTNAVRGMFVHVMARAMIVVEADVREQDPGLQHVVAGSGSPFLYTVTSSTSTPRATVSRTKSGCWLVKGGGRRGRYRTKALAQRAAKIRGHKVERESRTGLMLDTLRPCGGGLWTVLLRGTEP